MADKTTPLPGKGRAWERAAIRQEDPLALGPPPGQDQGYVDYAYELFREFDQGTRSYREKCRQNEKLWRSMADTAASAQEAGDPRPVTPVLFATVENTLADLMDNYPEAFLVGQEIDDDPLAEKMSAMVDYILLRRGFKATYREKCRQALKMGASVLEVYWDKTLYGGHGDVNIRRIDIRDFYWDPKATEVQEGRACFKTAWKPLSYFKQRYPDKWPYIQAGGSAYSKAEYESIDAKDRRGEALLLEHWYRVWDEERKRYTVHMGQMANGVLLFWSEDVPELEKSGMYEHGQYPFIVEPFYPMEGEIGGLGMVDIFGDEQRYINKLDQLMMRNILMSAQPKMLVNRNAEIDPAALADWESNFVEASRIDDAAVRWFPSQSLSAYTGQVYSNKIDRMERDSGQNAFARGEVTGGVTAASGIMALQEAGNKRSRLLIDQLYDGFEKMVRMMLDLICENYTEARYVRVGGERMRDGDGLTDRQLEFQPGELRLQQGHRSDRSDGLPYIEFDIQVHAQRETATTTAYMNELAAQMVAGGQLQPDEALSIMQFKNKDRVLRKVEERMARQQQMEMLQVENQQLQQAAMDKDKQIEQLSKLAAKINESDSGLMDTPPELPADLSSFVSAAQEQTGV